MSDIPPFTVHRLVQRLLDRWYVAASIITACVLLGMVYLHVTPPTYSVEMQIVTAANEDSGTQSAVGASAALLSQLGGGRANTSRDNFELYLAGLTSIETARILAQNPALMHRIFAGEWSQSDNAWRRPFSLPGAISRFIKGILGIYVPPWQPPDAQRLQEFLAGNIAVSRSVVSPIVTISIQTADRRLGVDIINAVHEAVDGLLRRRTLVRATGYVEYLNGLIQSATIVEYRTALAETIMQQEKVRMTAASSAPYAADIFARPTPSRVPTKPNGIMTLIISAVIGMGIALAEAVLGDRLRWYKDLFQWSFPGRRRKPHFDA